MTTVARLWNSTDFWIGVVFSWVWMTCVVAPMRERLRRRVGVLVEVDFERRCATPEREPRR